MRIFLAGATGVLGMKLIPKLLERDIAVIGTSSTKGRLSELKELGVDPVLMNGLDRDSVIRLSLVGTGGCRQRNDSDIQSPELQEFRSGIRIDQRLRAEGTAHLWQRQGKSMSKRSWCKVLRAGRLSKPEPPPTPKKRF